MEQIKEISLTMVKMIRDRSEMGQLAQFEETLDGTGGKRIS